jgi:hypothetical protein
MDETALVMTDNTPEDKWIAVLNACNLNGLEAFRFFTVDYFHSPHERSLAADPFILIRVIYTSDLLNGITRMIVCGAGFSFVWISFYRPAVL